MKLATDVTLPFLSAVNNGIFLYFFMLQVWTMRKGQDFCYFFHTLGNTWTYTKQGKLLEADFKIFLE